MITLTFRSFRSGLEILVRGAYFRICADGTLRGPDNTIAARFQDRYWYTGRGQHESFECAGPIYLRITTSRGQRECIGPFPSLTTADGAIFCPSSRLGAHAAGAPSATEPAEVWSEVALLANP